MVERLRRDADLLATELRSARDETELERLHRRVVAFKRRYSQAEIVELTMSLGSWLAFGRLNRVLGLDTVCVLPTHLEPVDFATEQDGSGSCGAVCRWIVF